MQAAGTGAMKRIALLALVVAACQPWYRDAENAGRRAGDTRRFDSLMAEAHRALDAGDQPRALRLVREALRDHPDAGSEYYRLYASLLGAADHPGQARAVLRFALERIAPGDSRLRSSLATSYVIDDLIGPAIEATGATSVAEVAEPPELVSELAELQQALAAATAADAAIALEAWQQRYGCTDHPMIAAAVDQIQSRIWSAATTTTPDPAVAPLGTLLVDADAAIAAGEVDVALSFYAEAARVLPASALAAHAPGIAAAVAALGDPVEVDAETYQLAVDAETALAQGDLGTAIRGLRRALARAPWWRAGHDSLAALLGSVGQPDAARLCRRF